MTVLKKVLENKSNILIIFLLFCLLEGLSFLSYYLTIVNSLVFLLIVLVFLILSLFSLEKSFYLLIAELFFNSMGYVFHLEIFNFTLSLRIALWSIFMTIFLGKIILKAVKERKNILKKYWTDPKLKKIYYLLFFILFALTWGLIKNNPLDVFFDFNAWLYLLIIFPLYDIIEFRRKQGSLDCFWLNLLLIFIAASIFLSFKSLLLLFFFSHDLIFIISDIYYWTRSYRLGEITRMDGGFYRIFLQAQIFVLFLFLIMSTLWSTLKNRKEKIALIVMNSFFASVVVLSFSRSFWLGLILALSSFFIFLFFKYGYKKAFSFLLPVLASTGLALVLIFVVLRFPWPNTSSNLNLESLSDRVNLKAPEAAISSRWALLDVMKGDLRDNFILGRGFGARLEYQSSDPRVLEKNSDGIYSTYAFEWGWLDIWLKLGLLGLISYLYLLFVIFKTFYKKALKEYDFLSYGLILVIIALASLNFFTPYLNHPLGLGILVLLFYLSNFIAEQDNLIESA